MVVLIGGERALKVDAHTHLLPKNGWSEDHDIPLRLIKYDKPTERGFSARLEYKETGKLFRELKPNLFDEDIVLQECDQHGVDVQVCCTVPVMFNYHMPAQAGVKWAKFLNDDMAACVKRRPDRLVGLGTLPLQDTEASVREVQRCLDMGIAGFQIGSHVNAHRGKNEDGTDKIEQLPLNHPDFRPVWKELERSGACVMVHPWDMEWWCPNAYWQPWLVGMPTETTLAGTALILGGVLQECPNLKVMMSHGGGALPYLIGRIEWGYRCRPDLVAPDCKNLPRKMIKKLYFDSITHDEGMLKSIVGLVGSGRVMLGSDYPFPLGEVPSLAPASGEQLTAYPGQLVETSGLTGDQKRALLATTALDWLGLSHRLDYYMARVRDESIPVHVTRSENEYLETLPDELPVFVVDSFTPVPYAGNPAAVVFVPPEVDNIMTDNDRRSIARQMNLSETAYVVPQAGTSFRGASLFNLRWFTPDGTEVNLCGHATLATAKALINAGNKSNLLTFHTLSGALTVRNSDEGLQMTLPHNAPIPSSQCGSDVEAVVTALEKVVSVAAGNTIIQERHYSAATKKLVLRLKDSSMEALLSITADMPSQLLEAHDGSVVKGVIVTNLTPDTSYDFQSRYFAPWVGIPEDPVTGSAHTVLGPLYRGICNKSALKARQCSARGGDLLLDVLDDRVLVTGNAAVVLKGEVILPLR